MNVPELPYGQLTAEQQAVVRMWYALGLKVEWKANQSWQLDSTRNKPDYKQEILQLFLRGELDGFTHRLAPGQNIQGALGE